LLHEVGILADRLADREEDHPGLLEFLAERRGNGDAVEHRVDRDLARPLDPGEHLLLLERDAELLVDLENFRIDLVEALQRRLLLRRGVVVGVLVVDLRVAELGPVRLLHLLPQAKGLQAPLEHPLGLALLGADEAHGRFVEPLGRELLLDVDRPAVLVLCGTGGGLTRGAVLDVEFVGHAMPWGWDGWRGGAETRATRGVRAEIAERIVRRRRFSIAMPTAKSGDCDDRRLRRRSTISAPSAASARFRISAPLHPCVKRLMAQPRRRRAAAPAG